MDVNALFLASLYGVFMGSYPVPIKTRTVLAANVHPIIFQSFKSTWVFVTGLFFLIPIALRGESFHFSWWGVASAAAWVPSGFGTISAVPRIGVSLTIVLSCSWSSVLNFLVFWLVIGEEMKTHTIGGRQIFLAPIYLGAIVLGMAGLVYGPRLLCADPKRNPKLVVEATNASAAATSLGGSAEALLLNHAADAEADAATTPTPLPPRSSSLRDKLIGLFFAIWAGTLAAVQYAIVSLGKQAALAEHGCFDPSRTSSAAAPPPQPPPRPSRALLPTLSPPTLPPLAPPPPSDACSIVVQSFDTVRPRAPNSRAMALSPVASLFLSIPSLRHSPLPCRLARCPPSSLHMPQGIACAVAGLSPSARPRL